MLVSHLREFKRTRRHLRIRRTLSGTAQRPRVAVFRSNKNLFAQVIDDTAGKTLLGLSTLSKDIKAKVKYGGNVKAAEILGDAVASEARKLGIEKIVFDRGGYQYHGRVRVMAESLRRGGLVF